nr:MAG TPA: hypothetical protein [Crassvirales sp.]
MLIISLSNFNGSSYYFSMKRFIKFGIMFVRKIIRNSFSINT